MHRLLKRIDDGPPVRVTRSATGSATSGPSAVFAPVPVLLVSLTGERHHRYSEPDGTIHAVTLRADEALLQVAGTWLETSYVSPNNALAMRSYEGLVRMVYIEAWPAPGETLHRGQPVRVLEYTDAGGRLANVMGSVVRDDAPATSGYLEACVTIIIGEIERSVASASIEESRAESGATWRMLVSWVQESVGAAATRAEAAAALRMHPSHISRICRKHGTTYSRLLHSTRIRYARELLASTPLTASEIAYTCGYADPPNFHHQFRTHTGCTPGEYRAAHTNGLTL